MTINIFISYSHKDEAFREQLAKHMVPLQRVKDVEFWFDGDILPGEALTPRAGESSSSRISWWLSPAITT